MDDDQEWTVFLNVYRAIIAMYGIVAVVVLAVQLLMWGIRKKFPTESPDTLDQVTREKEMASLTATEKSFAALSIGSISSTPSACLPMSNVSSVSHLDARSLQEEHSVEPVVVKSSTTEVLEC